MRADLVRVLALAVAVGAAGGAMSPAEAADGSAGEPRPAGAPRVLTAKVDGAITLGTAEYLESTPGAGPRRGVRRGADRARHARRRPGGDAQDGPARCSRAGADPALGRAGWRSRGLGGRVPDAGGGRRRHGAGLEHRRRAPGHRGRRRRRGAGRQGHWRRRSRTTPPRFARSIADRARPQRRLGGEGGPGERGLDRRGGGQGRGGRLPGVESGHGGAEGGRPHHQDAVRAPPAPPPGRGAGGRGALPPAADPDVHRRSERGRDPDLARAAGAGNRVLPPGGAVPGDHGRHLPVPGLRGLPGHPGEHGAPCCCSWPAPGCWSRRRTSPATGWRGWRARYAWWWGCSSS